MAIRLMEAAVWAIARWADTYLLPSEPTSFALATAFGAVGNGPGVLAALVRLVNLLLGRSALRVWPKGGGQYCSLLCLI